VKHDTDQPELEVLAAPIEPTKAAPKATRLDELAKAAGLLPQFMATGQPSRPMAQNKRFWLYRAICVRYRWNEHSRITQTEFETAVAAVSNFSV
jgi:hypothetical protein